MRPRPRKKSALLMTMGIISIVFGVLGLICGVLGAGSVLVVKSMAGPLGNMVRDMMAFMQREVPYWMEIRVAKEVLVVLLSALLTLAGVGLIMNKKWGRAVAVLYAVTMIGLQLGFVVFQFAFVLPALEKWQRLQPGGAAAASNPVNAVSALVDAGFWLVIAVALVVTMLLPAAGAAFRPDTRGDDDGDDFDDRTRNRSDSDDEFDDRPRRRRADDHDDPPPSRHGDDRFRSRDD